MKVFHMLFFLLLLPVTAAAVNGLIYRQETGLGAGIDGIYGAMTTHALVKNWSFQTGLPLLTSLGAEVGAKVSLTPADGDFFLTSRLLCGEFMELYYHLGVRGCHNMLGYGIIRTPSQYSPLSRLTNMAPETAVYVSYAAEAGVKLRWRQGPVIFTGSAIARTENVPGLEGYYLDRRYMLILGESTCVQEFKAAVYYDTGLNFYPGVSYRAWGVSNVAWQEVPAVSLVFTPVLESIGPLTLMIDAGWNIEMRRAEVTYGLAFTRQLTTDKDEDEEDQSDMRSDL